jgi:hypothetical protein
MYDYLTELHQPPPSENNEDQQQQQEDRNIPDGSISILNSPYDNQHDGRVVHAERQRRTGGSTFNCACSRTTSSDNIHQTKNLRRQHHRICSLS